MDEPSETANDKSNKKKKSKGRHAQASEEQKKEKSPEEENPDFKFMIRVANTNIDGNKIIPLGLTAIKGIGVRIGIAITDKLGLPRDMKIGNMSDEEVDKLSAIIENINKELPSWIMNRQKDFETGNDMHIISAEVQSTLRDDLNRLKKIRCYRGIRHEQGQKVRGQRTRANGRSGVTVGVQRRRVQQQKQKSSKGK